MPGPTRKPDAQRRNQPKPPDLRVIAGELEVPAPPDDLDEDSLRFWDEYWRSELAASTNARTDLPAFRRLALLYTEIATLRRATHRNEMVAGSQGQPVANPAFRIRTTLEAEARQLEDRFGLNPRARLNLGLQLGQVRRSLEDLTREMHPDGDDDQQDDPRIIEA